jgi:pimeloyl-ACP methyl ester carboxylesterase
MKELDTVKTCVVGLVVALFPVGVVAQDNYFNANGVRIHYIDRGAGEPVVLVDGYTNDAERNWIDTGVVGALSRDHRVIALDLRGHGRSDKPHDPSAYGTELALDIVRLLDHLHIARAHIVGYSLGGIITAKLLTLHEERFITATLVAASGRRNWNEQSARAAEEAARELEAGVPYRSLLVATAPRDQPAPTEDAIRQAARDLAARNDTLAHAALRRGDHALAVTNAQLLAVKSPVLAIVGTSDAAAAGVRTLKTAWPALEVVSVEGATHWGERGIPLRPEFVAAVRRFITARTTSEQEIPPAGRERALRAAMAALAKARHDGDGIAWGHLATDAYVVIHTDGRIHRRAEEIAEVTAAPMTTVPVRRNEQFAWYGDAMAVLTSEFTNVQGRTVRAIDVWIRDGSAWKIAAAQVTAVTTP